MLRTYMANYTGSYFDHPILLFSQWRIFVEYSARLLLVISRPNHARLVEV